MIFFIPDSVMDPSEVEFLAEKEKISILTNFSENKIYLIGVRRRSATFIGKLQRLLHETMKTTSILRKNNVICYR